jgi:hypothetical protein
LDTISLAKSGCKFIIIPLALAIFLIVLMIALSHRGVRYQMDVSGFLTTEPEDGASVRLDGIIKDMQPTGASLEVRLCDAQSCVDALVPIRFGSRLKPESRVIMSGIYRQQKLHVSDVLTRCHD